MRKRHLSLVDTKEVIDVELSKQRRRRDNDQLMAPLGYQMALPLDGEASFKQIVVTAMDNVHGAHFCELILRLRPRAVIDLRYLVRFDLPGTSREEIFSYFGQVQTLYVHASLPWPQLQPKDFIFDDSVLSNRLNHEVLEREDSPIMLLAPKAEDVRNLAAYFHRLLSIRARSRWIIEQAV